MENKSLRKISFWISLGILLSVSTSLFAKVFESKTEALKDIFGASATFKEVSFELNKKEKNYLEDKFGDQIEEREFTFYVAKEEEKIKGYATVVLEFGRDGYNKLLVAIAPEGEIDQVKVLESRDSKGKKITRKRFLRQFEGKSYRDDLKINQDIMAITGATISSKATAEAARKAIVVWQIFFNKKEDNNNL